MDKTIIQSEKAPAPVGPYSQAVESGGFIFCSGQISIDPKTNEVFKGGIEKQTEMIMENIKAVLEAAKLNFNSIIKTTIFLTDMNNFSTVNTVYSRYFKEAFPARSTIAVAALPKGVDVEIEVIARR